MRPQASVQDRGTDVADLRDHAAPNRRPDSGRGGALWLGRIVNGRYRVIDSLGAGSLGTVYLCEEVATGRKVALKIFRRDVSRDDEFLRRLRRQVKLASTLGESHPIVVTAYECGRTDDGSAFIVTEYLQGRTLRDIIRRGGPLDVQRALRLACQIAEGLDAIHGAGFVHGDVRPENVVVVPAGDDEVAKLKGFEVAGLRDTALVDHLIRAGVIPPNTEYLAPEQVDGDRTTVRTDVYAFGVVLYEMLAGSVPFSGTSPDSVMARQLQEVPAPLSMLRRGIPSVVESRVKQALEKEPERRQRYVGDVANEYLCELSNDEMRAELARQKRGVIRKVAATTCARRPRIADAPAERASLVARWKIGVAMAALAIAAFVAVWLLSPFSRGSSALGPWRPAPLEAQTATPTQGPARPDATVAGAEPEPVPVKDLAKSRGDAAPAALPVEGDHGARREPVPPQVGRVAPAGPTSLQETSLRPPGTRARVPTIPPAKRRTEAPERTVSAVPPQAVASPSQPARPEAPPTPLGASDPTAIIDWLLGQPRGIE